MLYRLPNGAGPVEVGVPLKGTHLEPPTLLGRIGCVPFLDGTGKIGPGSELMVVVVCICGVVESRDVSR